MRAANRRRDPRGVDDGREMVVRFRGELSHLPPYRTARTASRQEHLIEAPVLIACCFSPVWDCPLDEPITGPPQDQPPSPLLTRHPRRKPKRLSSGIPA